MPRKPLRNVNSPIITIASIAAALFGVSWPISIFLVLTHGGVPGQPSTLPLLLTHPLAVLAGAAQAAAFGVSAWLIQNDDWRGAALASALYLYGIVLTVTRHGPRSAALAMVALLFTLAAWKILRAARVMEPSGIARDEAAAE